MLKYGGDYAGAYLLRRGLFMPWELEAVFGKEIVGAGMHRLNPISHIGGVLSPRPATSFGKVAVLELSLYMRNQLLRDTDWASMAHSLEVRVPLVDVELLRRVSPLLAKRKRRVSKRLLANSPRLPLPTKIMERAKTGFCNSNRDMGTTRPSRSKLAANSHHCGRQLSVGETLGL